MLKTEERSFDTFYLSNETRQALAKVNYTTPTQVQAEAIPLILAGIDLTLQSQTGSGKTAAFAIPLIEMLEPKPGRIDVLVMTPTRELAKQVCDEFEHLGEFKDLKAISVYGGTSYEKQYAALETANIVVATPGRLLDLCEKKKIDLSELRILVLDEADEMLSMGFRDDIEKVITHIPEERQSILCSATFTEEIKALANKILFYPEFITLSTESVGATDVTHGYYNVRGVGRPRDLLKVLEYEEPDSAIIFANTKSDTFTVTSFLKRHGYKADALNGDLPQKDREKTLHDLRDGKIDFIVATDVAARGIDISDLTHVINYTLPDSAEVYIHRTGRTGRAGKKGKAISLIAPTEVATFFQVRKMYDIKLEELSLPSPQDIMQARQQRALKTMALQLESANSFAYGAYLRMAEELLAGASSLADDTDPVRMVARLLAMAENYLQGDLDAARRESASPVLESPSVEESKSTEPTSTKSKENEPVSTQQEPAPTPEAKPETPAVKEVRASDVPSRRRSQRERRQSSGDQMRDSRHAPLRTARDEPNSDDSTPSRRRRRTRSTESTPQATATTAAEPVIQTVVPTTNPPSDTRKMYLNIGRNAFDSSNELIEMLCFLSGMDTEDFADINLESSYSFVHVRKDYFSDVVAAINGAEWKGNRVTAEPARK